MVDVLVGHRTLATALGSLRDMQTASFSTDVDDFSTMSVTRILTAVPGWCGSNMLVSLRETSPRVAGLGNTRL